MASVSSLGCDEGSLWRPGGAVDRETFSVTALPRVVCPVRDQAEVGRPQETQFGGAERQSHVPNLQLTKVLPACLAASRARGSSGHPSVLLKVGSRSAVGAVASAAEVELVPQSDLAAVDGCVRSGLREGAGQLLRRPPSPGWTRSRLCGRIVITGLTGIVSALLKRTR